MARSGKKPDARYPITQQRLADICHSLGTVCSNTYESKLFKAAYTLAFAGFLRISEVVGQPKSLIGGRLGLQLVDLKIFPTHITLQIAGSKTDQSGRGHSVTIHRDFKNPHTCPIVAVREYLHIRSKAKGPLFIHFNGSPLTRYQFQAVLKKSVHHLGWNTTGFSAHSFRIGKTTQAFLDGVPMATIMKMGRWKSGAVHRYIRPARV